jgi:hypothetical protein
VRPFVTGIHLGLLQSAYLFGLQRAISAAHGTYALVVGAWLIGSLVGLWWRASPRFVLGLGLAAHVAAGLSLASVDFTASTAALWAPAIAAGGLYSGRYFVAAIDGGAPVGRVFARETYGFLVGASLALLVGVTGGRVALVVAPVVSGVAALALGPIGRGAPRGRRCR